MEPEIWGPNAWLFLHTVTFNYPKNPTVIDRNNYYDFFNSLQNVLPCPKCQEHFKVGGFTGARAPRESMENQCVSTCFLLMFCFS